MENNALANSIETPIPPVVPTYDPNNLINETNIKKLNNIYSIYTSLK